MRSFAGVGAAFAALAMNPLRSALTMLGVVIGVAAVIAMVAVGNGASEQIQGSVLALGSNLVTVTPGTQTDATLRAAGPQAQTLVLEDMRALQDQLGASIAAIDAERSTGRWQVVAGAANWNVAVTGVSEQYALIHDWGVQSGSFFTQDDLTRLTQVAVIGATTAQNLFGPAEPVGQSLQLRQSVGAGVRSISFRIVAVLEAKGSTFGFDRDDQILVPLTTAQRVLSGGTSAVSAINVKALSPKAIDGTTADVRDILTGRHRSSDPANPDFTVANQNDAIAALGSVTSTFTVLLGAIGGISLLVGGIGIMNIMLVSVKERTHEIGIRKAVGARRSDILEQFLVEAVALTAAGGALGVGFGWGITELVRRLAPTVTPLITSGSVAIAVGTALAVGVIFGLYPAIRAANLSPIDALHAV